MLVLRAFLLRHAPRLAPTLGTRQSEKLYPLVSFVGAIPSYQSSEDFTASSRKVISVEKSIAINFTDIPSFHCVISKVSANLNNHRCICKAFVLQVEKQHVNQMKSLICKTFPVDSNSRLTFYRMRHKHADTFAPDIEVSGDGSDGTKECVTRHSLRQKFGILQRLCHPWSFQ
jgi:hypothetical protein